ncbi:GIY-YIG nuclease family protein [Mycobacterium seoulense]|nr:GIY-YIG nuclease family protein [Mycobacterium seoulense]MCV7436525.1 GIY-YIG nuclease family protein [Mycobacterium seoulense]
MTVAPAPTPVPKPDDDFKLSITRALADQLHSALARLTPAPLSVEELGRLQQRGGVYVLFVDGSRVYVGKADTSLPARLTQHMRKLSGRVGPFARGAVTFVCLYVDEDLEASAPEKLLIKAYIGEGGVPWNNNGFGNKDPGRNRDNTTVKANHFDAQYPINLNFPVALDPAVVGDSNALDCITDLKKRLPYLLRFERGHTHELHAAGLIAPAIELPVRQWMALVVDALPGWLATALPGYVILYKEQNPDRYHSAIAYWRMEPDGVVVERAGQAQQAPAGVIDEGSGGDETVDTSQDDP